MVWFSEGTINNGGAVFRVETPSGNNFVANSGQVQGSGHTINALVNIYGRMGSDVISNTTSDTVAPTGINVYAAITYAAIWPNARHSIEGIQWSHNGTPSGAVIQVESPSGTVIWGPHYITNAGPGFYNFKTEKGEDDYGLVGAAGQAMIISLSPGSVKNSLAITGKKVV